ncbi:DUF4397 domain-containing protein [Terriglobus saanensis]|nr:DUF4397 domain-containing protein [Terriglobus saanensis]
MISRMGQTVVRALGLAVMAASSLAMTGCGSVTGSTTFSQLRVIDASPDSGGLDIYASGTALAYNLGFGTITSYVAITPGTYTVQVKPAGSATAVLSTKATLPASKQFTLLVGNVNAGLEGLVLADQSGPAPSGQIALRFLNEATKIGALDIYLVPSSATLLTTSAIATGVVFDTNTGYLNVPVGTYKLYILPTGTVVSADTVPTYTGSSVTYPQGSARTIVLLDTQVTTAPAVQVITANDYDSATATS